MRGMNMKTPKLGLAKVKKVEVRTAAGWRIEKQVTKETDRVAIKIVRPDGLLRFRITMTLDEWKELKK